MKLLAFVGRALRGLPLFALLAASLQLSPLNAQPVTLSGGLAAGGDVVNYAISPDGRYAVFIADKDTDGKNELYSVRLSTGAISSISGGVVANGGVFSFQISPDSARVVFRGDVVTDTVDELFSVPMAGGSRTALSGTIVAGGAVFDNFQISPDSARVVFYGDVVTDNVFELFRVQIGGVALALDIDGDDRVLPLTDLLLLTRYQLGMRGSALITNALSDNATITGASAIESRIRGALGVGLPF
jgi:dipeptidyl aminopeptidase/acylaminoacyl peptidase